MAITESTPLAPPPVALEVVLPTGARIQVPAGFDPEHLRRVVEALESEVLSLAGAARIYLCRTPVDFRKAHDGLVRLGAGPVP